MSSREAARRAPADLSCSRRSTKTTVRDEPDDVRSPCSAPCSSKLTLAIHLIATTTNRVRFTTASSAPSTRHHVLLA